MKTPTFLVWFAASLFLCGPLRTTAASTTPQLTEPTEIQGVPCQGKVELHDNGRIKSCDLARDHTISGHLLPAGTWAGFSPAGALQRCRLAREATLSGQTLPAKSTVFFSAQGQMSSCWLSADTMIQGHLCKAGSDAWGAGFYPDGKLRSAWLARDEEIDGVPCAQATFGKELLRVLGGGSGARAASFHSNGRLASALLARDATIQDHPFKKGEVIRLNRDGKLDLVTQQLQALQARIRAKTQNGAHTESALAAELGQFDALLAKYPDDKSDEVAQILYLKATVYQSTLNDEDKSLALFAQLQRDFPETAPATRAAALIAAAEARRTLAVGTSFPDFAETGLDGGPLSLASYKGKVVLIDFWATWCGPCVAELPHVVAAYQQYHERGFEVIGVSLDRARDRQKLVGFLREHEMPWPQFFDGNYWQNKLAVKSGVNSIPATYLLDREGKIAAKNLRGPALEREVARLLGNQ